MTLVPRDEVHIVEGQVVDVGELLSQADYEALKAAAIEGRGTDTRNLLLLQMLRGTGLRISEALALTPERVVTSGPTTMVLVRRGKKRGKAAGWEQVPLQPALGLALRNFIVGNRIPVDARVFKIQRRAAGYIVERLGRRALGRHVTPHQLRHLYIKSLVDGGLPIEAAAAMVGHSDPRITQQWYYRLTIEQRQAIQRTIPI